MEETQLKVGELARRTGLTVRTLHHWEEVGLLVPSERTYAGHRLYDRAALERVLRITALRGLGLSLEEVRTSLAEGGGDDLTSTLRSQLAEVELRIEREVRLRARLERLLSGLGADGAEPTTNWLIEAIEVMTMFEKHYTPEQLATLDERRRELGDEGMKAAEESWAELIADVRAERERGTEPGDPRLDPLLDRWAELVRGFTGGDPEMEASVRRVWEEDGDALRERYAESAAMPEAELMEWVAAAQRARAR